MIARTWWIVFLSLLPPVALVEGASVTGQIYITFSSPCEVPHASFEVYLSDKDAAPPFCKPGFSERPVRRAGRARRQEDGQWLLTVAPGIHPEATCLHPKLPNLPNFSVDPGTGEYTNGVADYVLQCSELDRILVLSERDDEFPFYYQVKGSPRSERLFTNDTLALKKTARLTILAAFDDLPEPVAVGPITVVTLERPRCYRLSDLRARGFASQTSYQEIPLGVDQIVDKFKPPTKVPAPNALALRRDRERWHDDANRPSHEMLVLCHEAQVPCTLPPLEKCNG